MREANQVGHRLHHPEEVIEKENYHRVNTDRGCIPANGIFQDTGTLAA